MASSLSSLNRMSGLGLMSGLDTEQLVKSMAANTKNRLNAKKQKLQTLSWKQTAYQSTISKIAAFQEKFLTVSSSSSVKANANMNKYVADASDSKVSASATADAIPTTYTISKATSATSAKIKTEGPITSNQIALDFSNNVAGKDYTVDITLDGTTHQVSFTADAKGDTEKTKEAFIASLNDSFSDVKSDEHQFEFIGDNLVFRDATNPAADNSTADGILHGFQVKYGSEAIGLANTASSRISQGSTLGDISFQRELTTFDPDGKYNMNINGVDFEFDKNTTISSMINTINGSDAGVKMTFSTVSQSFKMESTATGTAGKIAITQTDGCNLANTLFNQDTIPANLSGTNGQLTLKTEDGQESTYTSASNSYTFDGTTINIGELGDFDSSVQGVDEITVTTKKDTSSIKDTVVKFVDAYNTLISDIYGEINSARPKSSGSYYDPLTEEQEDEMDYDEIEKWNDQAKVGLLYHDRHLTNFVSSIRSTMTQALDGFSLSDMGITTSGELTDYGKLIINEDKLESCIETYGDKVSEFFTDPEKGMATKLNTVIDKAISKKTDNYGYLVQLAGVENNNSEKESMLYSQIDSLKGIIERLESKYEKETERYWAQFTRLETYMAQMQGQSSIFDTSA